MKVKLNVVERLLSLEILPKEGNFATLKVIRTLRESLSFSEEELKKYEIVMSDDGRVKWNAQAGSEEVEKEFADFAFDLVKGKLKKMNDENKLEDKHFTLYEKFVGG